MPATMAPDPVACPICGSRAPRPALYRLRSFDVIRCGDCGGLQRDPLPDGAEMESYYRDPAYIEGAYFDAPSSSGVHEGPEFAIFREALGHLEQRRRSRGLAPVGRLLDVGAGSGSFLETAAARGWQAEGVELSPELAARAEARSGARVRCGDFPAVELPPSSWDAITMWDVLEHTVDPGAFLDRARELLAPGGALVVFTIDAASLFNIVGHLGWRLSLGRLSSPLELLYDKRHNHYFTSRTLATLVARHGFAVEFLANHPAHLGRWLSEPASPLVLAGAAVLDLLSIPFRRPYRQLLVLTEAKTSGGGGQPMSNFSSR
jgi:2-polyprenyl-3-methyl-5-hydroxy-6-metoxy-1,4-benzoquinol methylase